MTTCAPRWPGRWEAPAADPAGQGERAVIGLRLVQALTAFWYQHGHATEGRRWLQRAMDVASADGGASLAKVRTGSAYCWTSRASRTRPVGSSSAAWPSGASSATATSRRGS